MKILFRFLSFFFLFIVFISSSSAYQLTETDYSIIDRVEEKLYEKIDNNPNFQPEGLVTLLENLIEKKKLDGKIKAILQTIVEDLKIDYS
jgi:hypothetical protein